MAALEKTSAETEKHDGDVTCIGYHDNKVISGGVDGKIKIWDNDLNLIRTVDAHESYYIYALAVNADGKVYTSSCDGCVKFMLPPYADDSVQELFRCDDAIQSMWCDGNVLYTGSETGVVTNWENDKMLFKYNLVEEVKSLAAEKGLIYTVRDLDVVISEVVTGKSGKYSNRAVIPGKSPLTLLGPSIDGHHTFLAFADRSGKGLLMVKNLPAQRYETVWQMPDCHELIINAICGNDKFLYSAGYDNKVKGWTQLEQSRPQCLGEVDVGSCVNAICCGPNGSVFVGTGDGRLRRIKFA